MLNSTAFQLPARLRMLLRPFAVYKSWVSAANTTLSVLFATRPTRFISKRVWAVRMTRGVVGELMGLLRKQPLAPETVAVALNVVQSFGQQPPCATSAASEHVERLSK
ncbi:hypothetical protein B1812_12380 [Methylocystis bryophila]|uniref:Uncharacterized protein n=1 Tax=Methylocystis bryophila TaxID=655015 RepID=A0A1W6MVW7_9HYPH|nr:hypothetical protein B1812_12380 [Methylocystis bryophila]